jgi:hypothetical protein
VGRRTPPTPRALHTFAHETYASPASSTAPVFWPKPHTLQWVVPLGKPKRIKTQGVDFNKQSEGLDVIRVVRRVRSNGNGNW